MAVSQFLGVAVYISNFGGCHHFQELWCLCFMWQLYKLTWMPGCWWLEQEWLMLEVYPGYIVCCPLLRQTWIAVPPSCGS